MREVSCPPQGAHSQHSNVRGDSAALVVDASQRTTHNSPSPTTNCHRNYHYEMNEVTFEEG